MRVYSVVLGCFAGLGSFLFGYDTGIITTSIAQPSFKDYMHNPNPAWTGAIVATYIAGEVIGALAQSAIGDSLGRKRFMGLMCIIITFGTSIQTGAHNFSMFLAGRILTGIAGGALNGTVPMYNVEISPPEIRGFVAGMSGLMIIAGTCTANWVGYVCGYAGYGQFQWCFPLAMQIPPGVILLISLCTFLPESPRWLILKGQDERAYSTFAKITGSVSLSETRHAFEDMREQVLYEQRHEVKSLREAWYRYRKRVFIAIAVTGMTPLTGVSVIAYCGSSLQYNIIRTALTLLFPDRPNHTLSSFRHRRSDRAPDVGSLRYRGLPCQCNISPSCGVGRVTMLKVALPSVMGILIYSAIMGHFFNAGEDKIGKGFAILGLYLFTFTYYLGINSTTWIYGVEVLPVSLRNIVTGWAAATHFLFNISVSEAGPTAFANIRENYYYVFAAATAVFSLFVYVYCPETKGRSLEAIAESFGDKVVTLDDAKSEVPVYVEKARDEQVEVVPIA
ncbi:unnamed protein product [Peniophora sp. CBMAI 1063]|nr:unnamed protein product [Peniophora sp. CBMAI 1063]